MANQAIVKIILSLLGLLLGIFIAEIYVRILGIAPVIAPLSIAHSNGEFMTSLNPRIKYVPKPGVGQINSYGIKGLEFDVKKDFNTFRIILLGDSVGYGFCPSSPLGIDETISYHIENTLNNSLIIGKKFEVLNLSVPGFDSRQEVAFFEEKGLLLNPDLIVLLYCLNDDIQASFELFMLSKLPEWELLRYWHKFSFGEFLNKSALIRLILSRFDAISAYFSSSESEWLFDDNKTGRTVKIAFEQLKILASRIESKVLVVSFPLMVDLITYPHEWEHRRTENFAKEAGFLYLDLLDPFRRRFRDNLKVFSCQPNDIYHPNDIGSKYAGQQIAREIASRIFKVDIEPGGL